MVDQFIPNGFDERQAEEAYLRYLSGAAMLHDPVGTTAIHRFSLERRNAGAGSIIVHAESLMLSGLQDVIRYAHPDKIRSHLNPLEELYQEAAPHMRATVDRIFELREERVRLLGASFVFYRPAPMLRETIYKHLCHSRLDKLKTTRLLDGVTPAQELATRLEGRRLADRRQAS